MVIHKHGADPESPRGRMASGIAFLICLAALLAVPDPQHIFSRSQPGELTALQALSPLLLETAPWLLLALCAGELIQRRWPSAPCEAAASSMWLPMVSVSLPLLGAIFTGVRACSEPFCAALDASGKLSRARTETLRTRALTAVSLAAPGAGRVLPSFTVGVGLAIATEAALPSGAFSGIGWLGVTLVIALAVVVRIGAAGTTVLVALLVHKGLPMPAGIVFTTLAAYLFRRPRVSLSFRSASLALLSAGGAAITLHILAATSGPRLHSLAAHQHPWVEWAAAGAILLWAVLQMAQSGPRAWFATLRPAPQLKKP